MSKELVDAAYSQAQTAMANLKASVRTVLLNGPEEGMKNAELGRTLGIYSGHVDHEGHISRTILALMEREGVVEQDEASKKWRLRRHVE
jgi:DNA-binding IclR family transcriptional regulator